MLEEPSDKFLKPIALKTALGFHYFDYDEIILFKADGHNVECVTVKGDSAIKVYHSLTYLEKKYCNKFFFRCNKSTIVNLTHINYLETKTRKIVLKNNFELKVSESFLKYLRDISKDNI
ncbi:MAG: LytTR family transcriptional regulator [Spirochaetes bacterium]|nr:LytTR family transcriptional regulator [Spirochaetota bacterium]